MPPGTSRTAAEAAVADLELTLVSGDAATGDYLFALPRVQVADQGGARALVSFPRLATWHDIDEYLATNHLRVVRWIRNAYAARVALVELPIMKVSPKLLDAIHGLFRVELPAGLELARVLQWAAESRVRLISYDAAAGSAVVRPVFWHPPVPTRRVLLSSVAAVPARLPATPPVPSGKTTVVMRLAADAKPATVAAIGARVGASFAPMATGDLLAGTVDTSRGAAILQLLSDVPEVQCVADSVLACASIGSPPSIAPETPMAPPVISYLPPAHFGGARVAAGVQLGWDAAPGATSYMVFRSTDGVAFTAVAHVDAALTRPTYTDRGAPAESLAYRVMALHPCQATDPAAGCDASAMTLEARFATPSVTVADPGVGASATPLETALAAPLGLVASATDGHVELSWTPILGVRQYRVYRALPQGSSLLVATTSAPRLIDTGGIVGNTYSYVVAGVGDTGVEGLPSALASAVWTRPTTAPSIVKSLPAQADRLVGTVRFEATVRSGDGHGRVEWRLSGPRAALVIGSAAGGPTPYDPLTWTASRVWDSTAVPDGTYTLRVVATDGDGNRSEVSTLFRVQNGAPSRPVAFTGATGPAGVILTWQQASAADAALYRLYRDGAAAPLAELPSDRRSFVDTSVSPGNHGYQLVLVDRKGHLSDPAAANVVVPAAPAAEVPLPVLQLRVLLPSGEALMNAGRVTDRLLLVSSVPPLSVSGPHFEYSPDGKVWTALATAGCRDLCETEWRVAELQPGPYQVRLAGTWKGGAIRSDPQTFVVQTSTPLSAPQTLSAHLTGEGVALSWSLPTTVLTNRIAVSRRDGFIWRLLDEVISASTYVDGSAPAGGELDYRLQSVTHEGGYGLSAEAAIDVPSVERAVARPASSLAAPSGVLAFAAIGQVTLTWQPVAGATGYIIERGHTVDGPYLVVGQSGPVTVFVDRPGSTGGQLYYRVLASDGETASVPSPATQTLLVPAPSSDRTFSVSQQTSVGQPVSTPAKPTATTEGSMVRISWGPAAENAGTESHNVYRFDPRTSGFTLAQSAATGTSYVDSGLAGGTTFGYVVTARDSTGNESRFSPPAWITTPAVATKPELAWITPSLAQASLLSGNTAALQAAVEATGIAAVNFAFQPEHSSGWSRIPGALPLNLPSSPASSLVGGPAMLWAATWSPDSLPAGVYRLRASVTDASGATEDRILPVRIGHADARGPPVGDLLLKATPFTNGVELNWSSPAGTSVQIRRSVFGLAGPFEPIAVTAGGSFQDRNLVPGIAHAYQIVPITVGDLKGSALAVVPVATGDLRDAVASPDQRVRVQTGPVSAAGLSLTVLPTDTVPGLPAGLSQIGHTYRIDAVSLASGAAVHWLDEQATLSWQLPTSVSAAAAARMAIYHWNNAVAAWLPEGGRVDGLGTRISTTLSHFSLFVLAQAAQPVVADVPAQQPSPVSDLGTTNQSVSPRPGVSGIQPQGLMVAVDGEVVSFRTATSATYQRPDGGFRRIINSAPINYQDSNGSWQKIDARLVLVGDGSGAFRNAAGAVAVRLPGNATDRPLSVTQNGTTVAMQLVGAQSSAIQTTGELGRYPGILPSVDAGYSTTPNGLKENLILTAAPSAALILTFQLQTGAVGLQLNSDRSVSGLDAGGHLLFTLASPWMVETQSTGAPAQSSSIGVTLTGADGLYTLAYAPDLTWLQDSARKYPVTLDPTITFQNNISNNAEDNHVDSAANYTHNNFYDGIGVDGSVGTMRTYARFYPMMSDGRWATSAILQIYQYTNNKLGGMTILMRAAVGAWTRAGITWSNQPGGTSTVYDTENSLNGTGWLTFSATTLARAWEQHGSGVNSDWGVELQSNNECSGCTPAEFYYSSNCGPPQCPSLGYHAILTLNYDDYLYNVSSASLSGQGTWVPSGGTASAQVVVQNLGTSTWDSTVRLSYRWLQNGTDISGGFTPRILLPTAIAPSTPSVPSFAVLNFQLSAPSQVSGLIQLQFAMMHDLSGSFPSFQAIAWSAYPAPNGKADVTYANGGAEVPIAPESYTLVGRNPPPLLVAQAGSLVTIPITLTNTDKSTLDNYTWQASNHSDLTQVGVRTVGRSDGSTVGSMAARTYLPQDVGPGASVNVDPVFQAPGDPGDYQLRLDLVRTTKAKDATISGGAKLGVAPALSNYAGTALQFDGSSGYVQLPTADFSGWPNANAYSVELWFKTTGSGVILGQTNGTLPNNAATSYVPALYVDTAGALRAEVFYHGAATPLVATGPYWDGNWHHVVDVYNVGTETLYVDGLSKASQSGLTVTNYTGCCTYFLGTGYAAGWPATPSGIGWWYFPGAIDQVATYTTALPATRIAGSGPLLPGKPLPHYQAASSANPSVAYPQAVQADYPVSYYELNDTFGSTIKDSSGPIWFADHGNQPLVVRLRVVAPGDDKAAFVPITQNDGSSLGVNSSNGYGTLQATDFDIAERSGTSLHLSRTYNSITAGLPDNGTRASTFTYGKGWTFDPQRNLGFGPWGQGTRAYQTGLLTDSQGKSWPLTWNAGRSLWEDAAGDRTVRPSTAFVDSSAGKLTQPGLMPVDLVVRSGNGEVTESGPPRGQALTLRGLVPSALILPAGLVPVQQNGSIEFWFSPSFDMTTDTSQHTFFSDTAGRFGLSWNAGGSKNFTFFTVDADAGTTNSLSAQIPSPAPSGWGANTWHHITITWQENGAKQLVIDMGAQAWESASSSSHGQSPVNDLFFGYTPSWSTGAGPYPLNGDLAELRIEGRVLSSTELSSDNGVLASDDHTLYLGAFTASNGVNSAAGTYTLRNPDQSEEDYTPSGQLIRERDRQGNAIHYTWDSAGRLTQIYDESLSSRAITITYPSTGTVLATDLSNRTVTYQISNLGDLVSVVRSNQVPDPLTGVVSSQPATTSYAYGPNHALQTVTDPRWAVTTLNSTVPYRRSVLSNSPTAFYQLDETSGTVARDASGSGSDGQITGNVAGGVSGALGITTDKAMRFDGSTGYIKYGSNWLAAQTGWTLEGWINPANSQLSLAVYNGDQLGGYGFGLGNGSGGSGNTLQGLFGNLTWINSGSTLPVFNAWYHVAMTNDGATTRFYINGTQTTGTSTATPLALNPNASIGNLLKGGVPYAGYNFTGAIDDVAIYNSALSQTRIQAHYNAAATTSTNPTAYRQAVLSDAPVAYYNLDEPSGTTVADSANKYATITGGVTLGVTGALPNASAMRFDGSTGYIKYGSHWLSARTSWSLEAWLNPAAAQLSLAVYNGDQLGGYGFGLGNGSGGSGNTLQGLFGNLTWINSGSTLPVFNAWYHVAMTNDGTTTRFYINGTQTTGTSTATPLALNPNASIGNLLKGGVPYAGYNFNGSVNEVAVYNGALSLSRIQAHYNAVATASGYRQAVLADAPVAYYPLEEAGGTTTSSLGVGYTAGVNGGVTLAVSGALPVSADTGMQFDGSVGSGITLALPNVSTATNVTVEFWAYHTGVNGIMPFGFTTYDLFHYNNALGFNTGASDVWGVSDSTSGFSPYMWHHVVAVFNNGNPQTNQLWIDGVQKTLSQIVGTTTTSGHTISSSAQISGWPNDANYRWAGKLDQVAVYTSVLSSARIQAHFGAAATASGYRQAVLADSPTAYYPLSESGGPLAHDNSILGKAGTIGGSVTLGAVESLPNASGSSMSFNGTSDSMIGLSLPSLTSAANVTVEFWAYHTGGNNMMPFGFNLYDLYHWNSALGFNTGAGDVWGVLDSTSGFSANKWHHVVAIFNNGNPKSNQLWVDGVSQTLSQIVGTTSTSGHTISGAAQISGWPTSTAYTWVGKLDEVAIYPTALNPTQILNDYYAAWDYAPPLADAPVAFYRLDEVSGAAAGDSSGTGNTGTINGGVTVGTVGAMPSSSDSAMTFDGGTGYISIADNTSLATTRTSVEAWIKVNAWVAGASIYNRRTTGNVGGVTLELSNVVGTILFYVYVNGSWTSASASLSASAWHHVVGAYDGATLRLYVDGALSGTASVSGSINNPASPLVQVGHNITGSGSAAYFNGTIDELAVYSYALSAGQVQNHYSGGLAFTPRRVGSVQDARGNSAATLAYNDSAAVTTVTDARALNGYFTFQQYGGRTLSVTDTGNNVTRYDWDGGAAYRLLDTVSPSGIRRSRLLNVGAPVGQQSQVLMQDTAGQPSDSVFDYVSGAVPAGGTPTTTLVWDPTVVLQTGKTSRLVNPTGGWQEHSFTGMPGTLIPAGATATQWVYLDPATASPGELMVQFYADGSWEHRAYWGYSLIPSGTEGTASRRNLGGSPPTGRWVPLTIALGPTERGKPDVDVANRTLTGVAFDADSASGRVWWGPLTFDFPSAAVSDPRRSLSRFATNDRNDILAAVDPNGMASVVDVDSLGLKRQLATGVEPAGRPLLFEDTLSSYASCTTSWTLEYGNPALTTGISCGTTAQQYSGKGSLQQTHATAIAESDLYRDLTGLSAGTYIRVTVWVQTVASPSNAGSPGTGGASLFIEDNLARPKDNVGALAQRRSGSVQTPSATWVQLSAPLVVDESGQIRIHLWHANYSGTSIWSDVQVEDLTPAPAVTFQRPATIHASDFEQSLSWSGWNVAVSTGASARSLTTDPSVAHSGQFAANQAQLALVAAPAVSASGSATNLPSGSYLVGYTYVVATGETPISAIATQTLSAGQQLNVSTSGAPVWVTSVKFYLTGAPPGVMLGLLASVAPSGGSASTALTSATQATVAMPPNASWYRDLSVTAQSRYRATVWVKTVASGGSGASTGVAFCGTAPVTGGVAVCLHSTDSAQTVTAVSQVTLTEGQWTQLQVEATTQATSPTLRLELIQAGFQGDSYWDDVVVQQVDSAAAWAGGWNSSVTAPASATWTLGANGGIGNAPTRHVSITASSSLGDIVDKLDSTSWRNGASYVVSLWASASVPGTTLDVSIRDGSGNLLPMDLPTSCVLDSTPTLCQNSLTYTGADYALNRVTIQYGGQGVRDVYVSHPLVALASTVQEFLPTGQPTRTLDIFGRENRIDYDSNGLYPIQQVRKTGSNSRSAVLADAPLAYWRLDEMTGTTAADSAGTNPGSILGAVTLFQPGGLYGDNDRAYGFDGSTAYVAPPNVALHGAFSTWSAEAWVKPSSLTAGQRVLSDGWVNGTNPGYEIAIDGSGNPYAALAAGASNTQLIAGTTGGPIVAGSWHYLAATWDGSTLRFYLDGVLASSTSGTGAINASANQLNIGRSPATGNYFAGTIKDVAVYGTALSANRIQTHYQAGRAQVNVSPPDYPQPVFTDSAVGYWRLGDTGTTATDSTANANNGALSGGITTGTPGAIVGDATTSMTFDGSTAGILITDQPTLYGTPQLSVEAWVYVTGWAGVNPNRIAGRDNSWSLETNGSGVVQLSCNIAGTWAAAGVGGSSTNVWYHVVGTYDGTAIRLYINGSLQATTAASAGITLPSTSSVRIGYRGDGTGYFAGRLEEVVVYPSALPQSRILAHYWAAQAGAPSLFTQLQYNALGQLVTATRVNGSQQITDRHELDSWGRITAQIRNYSASLPADSQTNVRTGFKYDLNGKLIDRYEPGGVVDQFVYDLNGNRTQQILNWISGTSETASQDVTTTDTYDAANELTDEQRPAFSAGGNSVRHTVYDNARRIIQSIENYGGTQDPSQANVTTRFDYDADSRITASYQPVGRTSTVMEVQSTRIYDVLGRLVTVVAAATAPTGVTAAPAQTDYTLDAGGRITDVLGPGTSSPPVRIRTHVDLDALGRTLATTQNADALGGLSIIQSHASYDPRGATTNWTPPTQQQTAGVATHTEFDLAGQTIRVVRNDLGLSPASDIKVTTSTAFDGYGRATDLTDPRGVVTHTDYDPLDRVSAVTLDPGSAPNLNLKTSYAYGIPGDLVTITRPRDGTSRTDQNAFDPLHRLTSSTLNYVSGAAADWQTNVLTQYTYDSQGRVLTVQDPLGRYTRSDYDMLGRTIAVTRNCVGTPAGTCNGTADWQTNVKTQWQMDKAGRVVAELSPRTGGTDSINLTTASSYDAQGRLVQVVEDAGASGNGHLNLTTSYGYDPVGNRLTMTDGRNNTTTATVDPLNRTTRVQDASSNLVQTQYSPAGEVTATINGRGQTNSVTLDRLGRVLTQSYLKADGVTAGSLSFTYDPGGLPLSFATADTPTTSVTYDAIGRVQSVSGPSSTSYAYFLDGTVRSVSDLTGTTNFGEDQLGRLSSTQDPLNGTTATTTYTVDAGSRLTKRVEASGISTAFTCSALDQLSQKTMTASGGASPFASWSNTYDLAGNRLSETSVLPGDTYAGTATFSYDTLQRLLTAAQPTQASLTYGYDAAHNRTSVSGGTAPRGATSFAYLANEALTTETPTGQSTLPYSPDADGNITADAAGHQLKYDSLNRLQEVRDSSGATVLASYVYDALGRLAKRTAGTAITQFFYRGLEDKVVQEQDGSNTVLRSYAWDPNGRRLSVQTGGSIYTVATNPHGDVVGLMTGAGSVVGWTHFDPWGQVLGTSGTTIPFGFQGGFTDPLANFGFVRMGIRWYDPREGRFVSEDPRGAMADAPRPLDENRWDYGLDDPVTYLDPLGLYAVHDECGRSCKDDDPWGFAGWQPHPLAHYQAPPPQQVLRRPIINPRSGMVMGYKGVTGWTWSELGRGAWSIIRGTPGAANDLLTGLTSEGIRRTLQGFADLGGMARRSVDISHMQTLRRQWIANAVTGFLLTPLGLPIASQLYRQRVNDQIRHSQHPWTEVGVQVFTLGMLIVPFAGEARGAGLVADVGGLSNRVTAVLDVDRAAEAPTIGLGTTEGGYSSFSAAKSALGSPGAGNVYDHIVEQSQMGKSGFLPEQIHNPENLNPVQSELNQVKANYYNSIQPFSNGLRVRNWLAGKSFEDQWNFGMSVTEDIWNGVIR